MQMMFYECESPMSPKYRAKFTPPSLNCDLSVKAAPAPQWCITGRMRAYGLSGLNQQAEGRDKRHSWAAQKQGTRRVWLIAVLVVLMC